MERIWDKVVKGAAAVGGAVAGLFGGCDALLTVLLVFMSADYVCGVVVAWMGKSPKSDNGGPDSRVGARGIAKKGLMMLVVLVAAMLDRVAGGDNHLFRTAAIWFYLANEGLSLMENLTLAGVPFPGGIKKALEQMKEREK